MSNLIEIPKLKPISDFIAEGKSIRQTNAEYLIYLREFIQAKIDSRKTN